MIFLQNLESESKEQDRKSYRSAKLNQAFISLNLDYVHFPNSALSVLYSTVLSLVEQGTFLSVESITQC